ncbi:FkbM family methyltransferase [Cellulomonas triticagri]|uniref:FkbM family methyltransferase n=1 Tax=Cellulomonas triticagri TaxID=2483352 RepID=UPI0011C474B9|nr:FkbM family methyltransferase [Cellulomonas triticagri]
MTDAREDDTSGSVVVRSGSSSFRLSVPDAATDYIQGKIASTGLPYEQAMLEDMASRLGPGDVVLDLGANVGNHTVYLAATVGCSVVAYEPNGHLVTALRRSVRLNGLDDLVSVRQVAVGEAAGVGTFAEETPENLGGQSISLGTGPIEVVRLDDEVLPGPPTLVKIDVEGMEVEVLRGAESMIATHRPSIYVECRTRDDLSQLDRWAAAHHYVLCDEFNATPTFRIEPAERLSEVERLDRAIARALRERFEAVDQLGATKARLAETNAKYRALTAAYAQAKAELTTVRDAAAETERTLQDAELELRERLTDAEQARRAASEREGSAVAERERARIDVADHRRALQTAREAESAASSALGRATLQARTDRRDAAEQLQRATSRIAELERALERHQEIAERERDAHDVAARAASEVSQEVERERAARVALERSTAQAADEAALRVQLLRDENRTLSQQRDAARIRAAASEADLRRLRGSVTFRTGQEVRRASSSVGAALRLPLALARLARSSRTSHPKQIEPAAPTRGAGDPAASDGRDPRAPVRTATPVAADVRQPGGRLRVAAIMDEFTRLSFAPEWDLVDLTPEGWEEQLAGASPDLLFVESAWRGQDGSWHNMVHRAGPELRAIVEWCRVRGVPSVFWNKEDPVHYTTFLNAAGLFDHVFTTDLDRVEHYKAALGHDRVWLLPFAAQPAEHHPIESEDRRDAFVFAGAYYRRYPERTRDLASLVRALPALRPVEIFDRNLGGTDEAYRFPEEYQELIVGTLAPHEVADAYRGYRFAVNLNSVKQSQTMLARRVFELLASNTLTVSNYARAARVLFGDLVVTTDDGLEAERRLRGITESGAVDELRLAGLRNVMRQHTYADRAAYLWSRVTGQDWKPWSIGVHVVATAADEPALDRVLHSLGRQNHQEWRATVFVDDALLGRDVADGRVRLAPQRDAGARVQDLAGDAELVACFEGDDYYGPDYLVDLALATRYTSSPVIGKSRYHRWRDHRVELVGGTEYRLTQGLGVRRSVIRVTSCGQLVAHDLLELIRQDGASDLGPQTSIDRLSYCAAAGDEQVAAAVDGRVVDHGVELSDLLSAAERVRPAPPATTESRGLYGTELAALFHRSSRAGITLEPGVTGLRVSAGLDDNVHDYIYATEMVPLAPAWISSGAVHVDTSTGLDLQLALVFYDDDETRLGSTVVRSHVNTVVPVPADATGVKLGIRVRGSGSAELAGVTWGHRDTEPAVVLPRARALVLTNIYPSYADLYRNGFVHSRVRSYRERGLDCEVFCLSEGASIGYREFEGIDVVTGSAGALSSVLQSGGHDVVMVHFLDPAMWAALQHRPAGTRVVIWIHGSEVQPWWRRAYNITSDDELEAEKAKSDARLAFWRSVFQDPGDGVRFVFVSRYLADEVMSDVGVELDEPRYAIVHNPIDTDLFRFQVKDPGLRFAILSIRPYASRTYANDLAVQAVLMLRDEPEFASLRFRFVGDGPLFDETLAPIKHLPNVVLDRRFLSQHEIVDLHAEHGIFLVPTRMDTHGVSRDEAMASGLVPVTNDVAAIPEFVDGTCGILAPAEDARAMADGVLALVRDPEEFSRMSAAAAARVGRQSSARAVISTEIELIAPRSAGA